MADEEKTDLKQLAESLGFRWPDDEAKQFSCMIAMAKLAAAWRKECAEMREGVYRERTVIHLQKRCWALSKRLTAVRRAAVAYKQGRDFDELCKIEAAKC